jgi:hypothetical protein
MIYVMYMRSRPSRRTATCADERLCYARGMGEKLVLQSFQDVIRLWPSRPALAADLKIPKVNVDQWYARNSVPAQHWLRFISVAQRRGYKRVTLRLFALLAHRATP